MTDLRSYPWDDEDFPLDALIQQFKDRALPDGYILAYGDYLRRRSVATMAAVKAMIGDAPADDPWTF